VIRVTAEAEREERKWEALWSYRANPPAIKGEVIPFDTFLEQLGLEKKEAEPPAISDEEVERLFKRGKVKLFPPGVGE